MYECFCVLCRVWCSLFTTSCQEGFSSSAAVLHCRQCSSLRAIGLTSGENRSEIQPFRLKLNGFKESWWWAILINGKTLWSLKLLPVFFYNLEQFRERAKIKFWRAKFHWFNFLPNRCIVFLSLTAAILCLFVVIATFVWSWLELEACSPSLRLVIHETQHCPRGRYVHLYVCSAHRPPDARLNFGDEEPMGYKSFTQPLLCWKMGGCCAKH